MTVVICNLNLVFIPMPSSSDGITRVVLGQSEIHDGYIQMSDSSDGIAAPGENWLEISLSLHCLSNKADEILYIEAQGSKRVNVEVIRTPRG